MAHGAEVIIEFLPAEHGGRRTPVWLAGEATNNARIFVFAAATANIWASSFSADLMAPSCPA
jgi:hypothetical protein